MNIKDVSNKVVEVQKVATPDLSQVVPSSVPSLSQVLSQACPKMFFKYMDDTIAVLNALKKDTLPASSLMKMVNEKNRNRFKRNILSHLIESELIVPTLTETPSSPKQRYTLTEKGKELMNTYVV